jgi:5-methylcytosine-specific restriction endonuclease McrA
MPDGVQLTRGMFLSKIKQVRGGKCMRCGYDKCLKALEFHHLDPSQKDFTISNDRFKLQDAVTESKKCILICSNCHKELHDGMWNEDDLINDEMEEVELDIE